MIGAVDIGGTKIAVAAVSPSGRIAAREESPTDPGRGFDDAVRRIVAMLKACAEKSGEKLEGIGIGCTGPVDPARGTVGDVPFLPGWKDGRLVSELSSALAVGAALENDADAHALGEYRWGAGRGSGRFIMVTFGTGIGGAFIVDGSLYRGSGGLHPEIGHHVLKAGGPACSCGARGCWECFACGPALEALYARNNPRSPALSGRAVCDAAREGEPSARAAVDEVGDFIGLGLANLVNLFAPDSIALGGGLMASFDLFEARMEKILREHCRLVPRDSVRVLRSELGGDAGLAGAAAVWLHKKGE